MLVVFVQVVAPSHTPPPAPAPSVAAPAPVAPQLAAKRLKACRAMIRMGAAAGVLWSHTNEWIKVDDERWARFPLEAKQGVLASILCEARGGQPLIDGTKAVAISAFSGRQLATYVAGHSFATD